MEKFLDLLTTSRVAFFLTDLDFNILEASPSAHDLIRLGSENRNLLEGLKKKGVRVNFLKDTPLQSVKTLLIDGASLCQRQ